MPSERKNSIPVTLFLLTLCVYGYFYNGGSWNQNARYDVIFSFVEQGVDQYTFRINRFLPRPEENLNTGDWSLFEDHYYSNKAPGTAFLGIPIYLILHNMQGLTGVPPDNPYLAIANAYLLNLFISGVLLSLAVVVLYKMLLHFKLESAQALFLSCTFAFGTMLFPYSTQLWGHPTAAAFVVFAMYAVVVSSPGFLLLAGASIGAAVLSDFLAALLVPLFAVWVCATASQSQRLKHLFYFLTGGFPLLLLGAAYNYICFGSPFALPTDYTNPEFIDPGHALGLFGSISLENLWHLTFGWMRGLFVTMPVLLLTPIGLYLWFRRAPRDVLAWICLFATTGFLLINASFNGWHGGATVCARYQILALPFWILPLRELLAGETLRKALGLLSVLSAFAMLLVSAVSPIAPDLYEGTKTLPHPNPFFGWVLPNFTKAQLAQFKFPLRLQFDDPNFRYYVQDTSWNWGQVFGLPGLWSLLPLVLLVSFFSWRLLSCLDAKRYDRKWRNTFLLKAAILVLFTCAAFDRNRLLASATSVYHSIVQAESTSVSLQQELRRAFPQYHEVVALRDQVLENHGPITPDETIYLQLSFRDERLREERGLQQRLAELLFPIRLSDSAKTQLLVGVEGRAFTFALQESE